MWWTAQQSGMIGAVGGSMIGVMGGLVGCLSFMVAKGKGKPLMVGIYVGMLIVGLGLLAAGVAAVATAQPRHVWNPLFLGGTISTSVFGGMLPTILARYRAAESRRFEAEQLRRS
jgi:hypothetical protein